MNAGYDGSITIDTSIDSKGFNAGMQKLSDSATEVLGKILYPIAVVKEKVGGVLSGLSNTIGKIGDFLKKALLGVLVLFAIRFESLIRGIQDQFKSLLFFVPPEVFAKITEIKNKWTEVQASLAAAFLPLIIFALPYIQSVLDWLEKMLNTIAMVTAAFLGQKEVLQVLPGSAQKLAEQMGKTQQYAEGTLASFDKINVLSTNNQPVFDAQMVPVANDILDKVKQIKDLIAAWWTDPLGQLKAMWGRIVDWFKSNVINPIKEWWNGLWFSETLDKLWANFVSTWQAIINNTINSFKDLWVNVQLVFNGIIEFLTGVFTGNWKLAWKGLMDVLTGFFGAIGDILNLVFGNIFIYINGLARQFAIVLQAIKPILQEAFGIALDWVLSKAQLVFTALLIIARNIVNAIIDFINRMIQSVVGGINAVIGAANTVGQFIPGFQVIGAVSAPQIPHLATGAVLPPNAPFMAIVGDQKNGTNIETPVDVMRKTFEETLAQALSSQQITVNFTGTGAQIARMLKPEIDRETKRVGTTLVRSGVIK